MKIGIVGWYGTETMGDMAILDGIFKIFEKITQNLHVNLGSLFPFYTKRTVYENYKIYKGNLSELKIDIFDVRDNRERKRHMDEAEVLILGGGPLMDLEELYPIQKSFEEAKRRNIPTILMGCGMGPLTKKKYIHVVEAILAMSDYIIMRDQLSVNAAKKLYGDRYKIECYGDPAVISIESYAGTGEICAKPYAAVNFREFPQIEYGSEGCVSNQKLVDIILTLAGNYEKVYLVPMHTFPIGGDDRKFLTQLCFLSGAGNVEVLHRPMDLYELYGIYANADGCMGMRYHSVVMQTILNGNNYILNYTDTKNGKINGFIGELADNEFYHNRVCQLKAGEIVEPQSILEILKREERFEYRTGNLCDRYVPLMERVLK